jgi:hypothetical protein
MYASQYDALRVLKSSCHVPGHALTKAATLLRYDVPFGWTRQSPPIRAGQYNPVTFFSNNMLSPRVSKSGSSMEDGV